MKTKEIGYVIRNKDHGICQDMYDSVMSHIDMRGAPVDSTLEGIFSFRIETNEDEHNIAYTVFHNGSYKTMGAEGLWKVMAEGLTDDELMEHFYIPMQEYHMSVAQEQAERRYLNGEDY